MHGKHRTWLLDDGRSDEMRELADELGCRYLRRLSSSGAKAGNVNHALTHGEGRLLLHLRRRLRAESRLHRSDAALLHRRGRGLRADTADLRQPAHHDRPRRGLHADGVLPLRPAWPEPLQRGVLRRHQRDVPPHGHPRDRRHLHRLQVRGRVDLPEAARARLAQPLPPATLAVGDAPETIEAYTKQQLRWATGGFEILLRTTRSARAAA